MTHLRRTVLAAFAVTLCATAPAAASDGSHGHGRDKSVMPLHKVAGVPADEFLGNAFARDYATPAGIDPHADRCEILGRKAGTLVIGPSGDTNACTVSKRTQIAIFGFGAACSDVEPEPFFGADEEAQRECALAFDAAFVDDIRVTVDGKPAVDIHRRRYEVISPQTGFTLPPDNIFGIPPRDGTLTAHAWLAEVRALRPGVHTVSVDAVTTDFAITTTFTLTVVRHGHSGHDDDR